MEKTWSHDFYRETDPAKRLQILKAHAGEEEAWAEEYRNRLWTARYGKYRLQKDEFVKCLMELKYLAEGSTLDLGGDRRRMGARILSALCLAEAMQSEECYQQILLEELYNVFLKFIQVSRGAEASPPWYLAWDNYQKKELQKNNARTDQRNCLSGAPPAAHGKRIFAAAGSRPSGISPGVSE